jgi:hypothetical protein
MNKQEEIAYVKKHGFCPYLPECDGDVDCEGKVFDFCRCRARDTRPEDLFPEPKEKVRFT